MYADIMNGHTVFPRKYIWKINLPLKIKIFMWFLYKKVILTKGNIAKWKWNGCKKYVLCDSEESINQLFFTCPFARLICGNMFGNWLNGEKKKSKAQIGMGICALMWAIWNRA
jgi:hypothetical protein